MKWGAIALGAVTLVLIASALGLTRPGGGHSAPEMVPTKASSPIGAVTPGSSTPASTAGQAPQASEQKQTQHGASSPVSSCQINEDEENDPTGDDGSGTRAAKPDCADRESGDSGDDQAGDNGDGDSRDEQAGDNEPDEGRDEQDGENDNGD